MSTTAAACFEWLPCLIFCSPRPPPQQNEKVLFSVSNVKVDHAGKVISVPDLKLTSGSRVQASGEAGKLACRLLRGELEVVSDGDSRGGQIGQPKVRLLSPKHMEGGDYPAATSAAWDDPEEVIVVEESLDQRDPIWTACFEVLLCSSKLESFKGAVIVCTSNDARSVSPPCSESWVLLGSRLSQEPCLEIVDDALTASDIDDLLEQAKAIDYCNLTHWLDSARMNEGEVALFAVREPDGSRSLRGFLSHRMIKSRGEFHIAFIFVPKPFRKGGMGGRLVRWAMGKAQRMPKSKCAWVSLEAADDDLVLWYEKFGFTDMTCGHDDDPEALIWMEAMNATMVDTPLASRRSSPLMQPLSLSRQSSPGGGPLSRQNSPLFSPLARTASPTFVALSRQSSPTMEPIPEPMEPPELPGAHGSPSSAARPSPGARRSPGMDPIVEPLTLDNSPESGPSLEPLVPAPLDSPVCLSRQSSHEVSMSRQSSPFAGPVVLSRQCSGRSVSIVISDADVEDVAHRPSRSEGMRLSLFMDESDDGERAADDSAQPPLEPCRSSRISTRLTEVHDEREVSKKIAIPREMWSELADEL